MRLEDFLNILEQIAPVALAEEYDNPGLIVEPEARDITRALVALDCTPAVAREAKARNCEIVLSHHPLFYRPVRRLSYSHPDTAAACALVRHGIGLYAAHTNLDKAYGGVNDALCARLGLTQLCGLGSTAPITPGTEDFGRLGTLQSEMTLGAFAKKVEQALGAGVRVGGDMGQTISRVAVVGGSGGSFLLDAKASGADVFITGEIKHSDALAAQAIGLNIVVAGHDETERVVLEPWIAGLQAALNAVQYTVELILAQSSCAPLTAL